MFSLLLEPRAVPKLVISETAAKTSACVSGPLPISSCFPTSNLGRIFTKTRGMTGSSVLPIVYRIFKSLKLSRKKVLIFLGFHFLKNKVEFVLVCILHCFLTTSGTSVYPSQPVLFHSVFLVSRRFSRQALQPEKLPLGVQMIHSSQPPPGSPSGVDLLAEELFAQHPPEAGSALSLEADTCEHYSVKI